MSHMVRILGVDISVNKTLFGGLKNIFGIGNHQVHKICALTGFHPQTRLKDIRHSFPLLIKVIETHIQPKALQLRVIGEDINNKIKNHSYQGQRHQYCLPVRGQNVANHKTQQKLGLMRAKLFSFPLAKPNKKNRK